MSSVVLDTNIVVSANLNDDGLEAFVVVLALNRRITWFVSEPILDEYERVLRYPRLKFLPPAITRFLARVRKESILVTPRRIITEAKHKPDNRFLECADEAQADFLVTGNTRHFPLRWRNTQIVNSRQLVESLNPTG